MNVSKNKWHYRAWLHSRPRNEKEIPERVDFCEYWSDVAKASVDSFFSAIWGWVKWIFMGLSFLVIGMVGNLFTILLGFGTLMTGQDFYHPFKPISIGNRKFHPWVILCPLWGLIALWAAIYFIPLRWSLKFFEGSLLGIGISLAVWGFMFLCSLLNKLLCKDVTFEEK